MTFRFGKHLALTWFQVSYNSVINACAQKGRVSRAVAWQQNFESSMNFHRRLMVLTSRILLRIKRRWQHSRAFTSYFRSRWIVNEFPQTCCGFSCLNWRQIVAQEMWLEKMLAAGVKTDAFSYNSVINAREPRTFKEVPSVCLCAMISGCSLKQWKVTIHKDPHRRNVTCCWGLCTTKRYWTCRNMVGVIPEIEAQLPESFLKEFICFNWKVSKTNS